MKKTGICSRVKNISSKHHTVFCQRKIDFTKFLRKKSGVIKWLYDVCKTILPTVWRKHLHRIDLNVIHEFTHFKTLHSTLCWNTFSYLTRRKMFFFVLVMGQHVRMKNAVSALVLILSWVLTMLFNLEISKEN